jgi:hypothetical protein
MLERIATDCIAVRVRLLNNRVVKAVYTTRLFGTMAYGSSRRTPGSGPSRRMMFICCIYNGRAML